MSTSLLLELGCEDLPARYVRPLAEALGQIGPMLHARGVAASEPVVFATPRRLAVLLERVAEQQKDQAVERKGPKLAAALKDGQPTPAALGFAKSCGVDFAQLAQEDGQLVFRKSEPGRPTRELLAQVFEATLAHMDQLVPKRMRWGSGEETFVRPVQWICCLLGEEVVPLQRFGLTAGGVTYGHRFHAPQAIALKTPAEYREALREAKVWADAGARKAEIERNVHQQAQQLGGVARISESLLDEVTALVEWPVVIHGRMEERFMQLPPEVIVSTVETNQRYFTVFRDAAMTQLLPHFITVCNIESRDVAQVIAGNERVVRPRLSDAMFFWEQDLKQPLEAYSDRLSKVTFQKDLGTVADKVHRICGLQQLICKALAADAEDSARAARLCKNDLVTRMVYEFPELQGVMGGYYATASGERETVARAIREHYLPAQQGTPIPDTQAGRIVSLADKLDTLAGIFAIGQKPSASKDPYGLRRAALGVLRICIEGELPLDLRPVLKLALEQQGAGKSDRATLDELVAFVFERLRAYYEQIPVEMFEAVRALDVTTPLDFHRRILALRGFWDSPEAGSLAAANKRMRNILKQAEPGKAKVDERLFEHDAERHLHQRMQQVESQVAPLRAQSDYAAMLGRLAMLKEPVDAFFADVMVMAEDKKRRANRLALLQQLDGMCREVADLACLPA
ncbi:MAG TPA: glycine--tRNA ligase subunit beta [Solimonas sp.]|nr:glycine--tRNA ligase subunit beta [Solimonas sp.]